jgi:hypothetical protein
MLVQIVIVRLVRVDQLLFEFINSEQLMLFPVCGWSEEHGIRLVFDRYINAVDHFE